MILNSKKKKKKREREEREGERERATTRRVERKGIEERERERERDEDDDATMNGGQWSDYGQQPDYGQPTQNQGNLTFVSSSFEPGRGQGQTSYNTSMNPTTSSFDDEPPLLEGKNSS